MSAPTEFPLGQLTVPESAAREVLALLHDAPERLVIAFAAEDHDEVLSVVSHIHAAIGEARRVYDDRIDRFLEGWNGPDRIEVMRSLSKLADATKKVDVEEDDDDEPSAGDVVQADDPVALARAMQQKRHGGPTS